MEKLCVFCERMHFDYDPGSNCETCGYAATAAMSCSMGHWNVDINGYSTIKDYRMKILTAGQCPDYVQVESDG